MGIGKDYNKIIDLIGIYDNPNIINGRIGGINGLNIHFLLTLILQEKIQNNKLGKIGVFPLYEFKNIITKKK